MIKSSIAYALTALAVIGLGFIKIKFPGYPHETTVVALVSLAGLYFGKRVAPRLMGMYKGGMSED